MISAKAGRNRSRVFRLAVVRLVENDRKCAKARMFAAKQRDQGTGIDAAREKNAYGHVAYGAQENRILQLSSKFGDDFRADVAHLRRSSDFAFRGAQIPIFPDREFAVFNQYIVCWRQGVNPPDQSV